jgi:nitrite reductase/ring-hydroxylating ferredoxin subunit
MAAAIALLVRDSLVQQRVVRMAGRLGLEALQLRSADGEPSTVATAGLLVELELEGAVDVVRRWREAHGQLIIVGFVATPEPSLWAEAEQAGADLVTTRGRADRELGRLVADHLSGARRSRRVRLAPEQDFAGRLGFVGRVEETPAGPVAIYHLGGELHAISDTCPHAGASLCEGEFEGDVVTCPRHGSQFRVTDGERVRGPADEAVATVRVLVEAGEVFLEFEAAR